MTDSETSWDQLLQIQTAGRDEVNADEYRYPYEPTPYTVLERLADCGFLKEDDVLLDYGCGKGRVSFFLAHRCALRTIGIEYDERIYKIALDNQRSARSGAKTAFVQMRAEAYPVPGDVNRCYFFNPFSAELLHKVMARILESYYADPGKSCCSSYYPSDEYVAYLMTVDELEFYDEILCDDLFAGDSRERILIFQLPGYSFS